MAIIRHITILIPAVIIVSSLRTPSSSSSPHLPSHPSTKDEISSKLSHATNVSVSDIVSIQDELGFIDPQSIVTNVVTNVTKTWSTITQSHISSSFSSSSSSSYDSVPKPIPSSSPQPTTVEEKWIQSAAIINELVNAAIKSSLPLMLDLAYSSDLSPKCSASLLQILSGIRSNQGWALSCKNYLLIFSTWLEILASSSVLEDKKLFGSCSRQICLTFHHLLISLAFFQS